MMTHTAYQKADIKFTYDDYVLLPEDKRYELIGGDLIMTPAPLTTHQRVSQNINNSLWSFVKDRELGKVLYAPVDVVFSEEDVVQPDILFIAKDRLGILTEKNVKGAPDLVIEILSLSNAKMDLVIKKKLYAKFGVREYWIVHPDEKSVEVMTWAEKGFKTVQVYLHNTLLRSPLLRDFSMPVNEIFL